MGHKQTEHIIDCDSGPADKGHSTGQTETATTDSSASRRTRSDACSCPSDQFELDPHTASIQASAIGSPALRSRPLITQHH